MAGEDFAVNARVRKLLARRWIRQDQLDVGTTDGVVLVRGRLEIEPGSMVQLDDAASRERFVQRLKNDLAAVPGVLDVVMELQQGERGSG